MSDLTARLLDPEKFEEALKELEALSVTCNGETKRAHLTLATSAQIVRELHARLRTAKAEGAAAREALDAVDSTLSECRYSFEVGRPLPCNCDIHAAHKIIDAARAGGGR